MKNRVITISRQFGSGGRTIGKELAKQLGIPCYDQEIIEKIAAESGLTSEYIAESSEYTAYSGWLAGAFIPRDITGRSLQDDLWTLQCRIIRQLAEKGSCVIVGRCADHVLEGEADLLKVFIHADVDYRARRVISVYGEKNVDSRKRVTDKDKRRAAYYNFYTDKKWGAQENYDISLNSGVLGIETCVEILKKLYRLPHAADFSC